MLFAWDPDMIQALAVLGISPGPRSSPTLVKDYVSALYRYELRRLRDRYVAGEIAKAQFKTSIIELRPRYWMLSIPAARWAEPQPGS